MKQAIHKTQPNHTIQTEKSKIEILRVSYFYDLFLKEKKRYAPSLFTIDQKVKAKRKRKPTLKEFKQIIYQYLKIYFYELYMGRKAAYFFLGGFMKVVTTQSLAKYQLRGRERKKTLIVTNKPLGLFWFMKPTEKMHYMVILNKLTGSSNILPKIEKTFKQNYDKDLLPIFTNEQKKGKINKTLYRCIQR